MKKILIITLLPVLFLSCLKSNNAPTCSDVPPSDEVATIQAYCTTNGINYLVDSSGIYYEILDPGDATKPTINSTISTTYVGELLNGTVVDQRTNTPYTARLSVLIAAWQIGLQKIGKGGHIKMVAPSSLCYGCYGVPPTVPSNAILYFDITLVDVQ